MVEIVTPNGAMLASSQPGVDAHFSAAFGRALRLMTHAPIGLLVEFPPGTLGGKLAKLTEAPLAGRAPAGTFFDLSCILLVATSTIEHLQLDVRRLRPNIVVRTSEAPFIENDWAGRRLAIGERVVLQTSTACPRCINVTLAQDGFLREPSILRAIAGQNLVDLGDLGKLPCVGVYADVVQPGPVAAGDSIRWLE